MLKAAKTHCFRQKPASGLAGIEYRGVGFGRLRKPSVGEVGVLKSRTGNTCDTNNDSRNNSNNDGTLTYNLESTTMKK